ncbi:MAG: hypothetical protein QM523_08775 [Candidatus Pacebacteria bacterium]|nr:hypothetical protein [Candidatus Paceibacterota bacterium]
MTKANPRSKPTVTERRAAALRENLFRRKAQSRAREDMPPATPTEPPPPRPESEDKNHG